LQISKIGFNVAAVLTLTQRPKQMQQWFCSPKFHYEKGVHFVKVVILVNLKRFICTSIFFILLWQENIGAPREARRLSVPEKNGIRGICNACIDEICVQSFSRKHYDRGPLFRLQRDQRIIWC
jgi:hypothetical protein